MSTGNPGRQRSVLVTGGTGFIGRWLVERLRQQGARVNVLIRNNRPPPASIEKNVVAVQGSLEDPDSLAKVLQSHRIDGIYHLAAQAMVSVGRTLPRETWQINTAGTWNLLEAARLCPVRQVVVVSSDRVAGYSSQVDRTPDPYCASKMCSEIVVRCYAGTFGVPAAIARLPHVYGGGDLNFSRLVPDVIQSALKDERVVMRSDGTSRMNLLYVKDAVNALLWVGERLEIDAAASGRIFDFCGERELTLIEIVEQILKIMNRKELQPVFPAKTTLKENQRSNTASRSCEIAGYETTGWCPQYDLSRGLKETIAWYRGRQSGGPMDRSESFVAKELA